MFVCVYVCVYVCVCVCVCEREIVCVCVCTSTRYRRTRGRKFRGGMLELGTVIKFEARSRTVCRAQKLVHKVILKAEMQIRPPTSEDY